MALDRRLTGDHIAIARRVRGMRQGELARRLGLRQSELSDLENGRRPIPSVFERLLWTALAGPEPAP